MKVFMFILLGFSLFLFQCGPGEVSDSASEGGAPIHEPIAEEPEVADSGMDQPTEISPEDSEEPMEVAEDEPQFTVEGVVFQIRESYTCTKEGSKTYVYEIYENPVEGNPYLCYALHKYSNCGKSWDPVKGYCRKNAVNQAGYCRNNVEGRMAIKAEEGYECLPSEQMEESSDDAADGETEGEGAGSESADDGTEGEESGGEPAEDTVEVVDDTAAGNE